MKKITEAGLKTIGNPRLPIRILLNESTGKVGIKKEESSLNILIDMKLKPFAKFWN